MSSVEQPVKVFFGLAQVHDTELPRRVHLLGGEADAAGLMHRFDHLAGERPEFGVKNGDRFAFFSQNGIVVVN